MMQGVNFKFLFMKLSIFTLKDTLFEGEVEKVITRTPLGEITVLKDHLPLISTLTGPNVRIVNGNGKEENIKINSGFI
ncbi:MAG: hypothetical protein A2174_00500, partial [Candidatus Portnoybacteria bacterium RBG_13_41_18]